MNTEVQINLLEIELTAIPPYVLQSCLLVPPIPAPEPEDENVISTPVPPGIEYESLPVINTETQIVDTSPDQLIGCVNDLPIGGEQQILNSLFPEAISGDGVVNRDNNDIWTYNGSTWTNVGPTPGPQLVVVSVLPPWNEIDVYTAKIRIKLQVQSLPYALNLLAEPPPIGITIGLRVIRLIPVAKLALAIHAPSIVTDTAVEIPPAIINIQALRPYVQKLRINTPPAVLQLSALAPYANSL